MKFFVKRLDHIWKERYRNYYLLLEYARNLICTITVEVKPFVVLCILKMHKDKRHTIGRGFQINKYLLILEHLTSEVISIKTLFLTTL